ncbi:MAG: UDP-N-acetylglucosamine--N-acetylmuramyl-(pentapeptide) pyrophosphoryl-undecaprenol N-acetylglucosamine transferase [Candidatus Curtissbacteria bacterium]|nr:UDP-N-acetylglucosamine--N-acetylmuramyl-(pentapeptide) pyrophosphoryl-undecaprenol N-acetylglucosamine transferase [Candidatus Curtissbacteria bacterium]
MKKIVITGGHLTPALAVVEALANKKEYKIIFFGRKIATDGSDSVSAEFREIGKRNITFVDIVSGRLTRKFTKYSIPSLLKIPLGVLMSFLYLAKYRPSLVVSFGGYLSTPVVFCAWLLGIDCLTHEQAVVPGFANRLNSLFVKKIFLSWEQTKNYFPKEKYQVIGTPQPQSLLEKSAGEKKVKAILERIGDMVVVAGGSQGSHIINNLVFENLDLFARNLVFHQIGTANYKNDHAKAAKIRKNNYFAIDYVSPEDIGAVFSRAKFVISRSGANTVWDLAMLAKPAILIPLAIAAGDEQTKNAQILETAGSAIILSQNSLSRASLKEAIKKMEDNLSEFEKSARAFQKTLPQNSTEKLVQYIYQIL